MFDRPELVPVDGYTSAKAWTEHTAYVLTDIGNDDMVSEFNEHHDETAAIIARLAPENMADLAIRSSYWTRFANSQSYPVTEADALVSLLDPDHMESWLRSTMRIGMYEGTTSLGLFATLVVLQFCLAAAIENYRGDLVEFLTELDMTEMAHQVRFAVDNEY